MAFSHCFLKGSVVKKLISREKYQAIHELIQRAPIFTKIHNMNPFSSGIVKLLCCLYRIAAILGNFRKITCGKTDTHSVVNVYCRNYKHGIDILCYRSFAAGGESVKGIKKRFPHCLFYFILGGVSCTGGEYCVSHRFVPYGAYYRCKHL